MPGRYFDDFRLDEIVNSAELTVTEADILQFRIAFDGQLSDTERSSSGAVSAAARLQVSLPHLLALTFRLFFDTGVITGTGRASPGIDEIRYRKPVCAGDRIRAVATIKELRPSASKPDRGTARIAFEVVDQHAEKVLTFTAMQLLARRTSAVAANPTG